MNDTTSDDLQGYQDDITTDESSTDPVMDEQYATDNDGIFATPEERAQAMRAEDVDVMDGSDDEQREVSEPQDDPANITRNE